MTELVDMVWAFPDGGLTLRMLIVATFVVLVAIVAERLGPFLGAMFASLPLYTGPIYMMLALQHDATYMTAATIGSLAICGATAVFVLCYCLVAHRCGTALSLAAAYTGWTMCAIIVQSTTWSLVEALLFVVPIYGVSVPLARGYTRGVALRSANRSWYDLPLRAVLCGGLAGGVIQLSNYVPPQLTGVASVMPILLTSLILVLHSRIGGAATAALLANTLGGLIGMVLAFVVVNQSIEPFGVWIAMTIGLAISLAWNISLITARHMRGRHRSSTLVPTSPLPAPQTPLSQPISKRPRSPHALTQAHAPSHAGMPPPPPPTWPPRR